MRSLVPFHSRITVLVRSRTKGLGGVIALMLVMFLLTIRARSDDLLSNDFINWTMGILVSYVAIPLVLAAKHKGLIGSEVALWLQKPIHELSFALRQFGETLAATLGLSLLFGAACVLIGMAMGWNPVRPPILALPVGALAALTIASMAFGTAAWLPRGSRTAVLALIIMGMAVFGPEVSQPELVRDGPVLLARFVLFPVADILRFGLGLTGDMPFRLQPVLITVAYAVGWVIIGTLGVWRAAAKGRIGYS